MAANASAGIRRVNAGRGHSYTIDGLRVPGVTTLIGNGLPKPALPYWSARTVAEYVADAEPDALAALRGLGRDGMVRALKEVPWSQRDSAAVRGTTVHKLAERLVAGERVDVPEALAGHVESAVRFIDEWRVRPVAVEVPVGSRRWGYAGTVDLIADLWHGCGRMLIDYKTARSGVWPESALQLAAYRYAESIVIDGLELPMAELGIEDAAVAWIRADGYDLIPVQAGEKQFSVFLHLAYVARQVEDMPSWIGEALQPEPAR